MKKLSAAALAAILALTLTACGDNSASSAATAVSSAPAPAESSAPAPAESSAPAPAESSEPAPAESSEPAPAESTGGDTASADDAKGFLSAVWTDFFGSLSEQFMVMGGDFDENNQSMDGPGKVTDPGFMNMYLHLAEADCASVADAASVTHGMNANTFTCGAFKVSGDVDGFCANLKDSVSATEWMCGFPDKLVIYSKGDMVISVFGNGELVDAFKAAVTSTYSDAAEYCDIPLA